jgi:hypothetical protein
MIGGVTGWIDEGFTLTPSRKLGATVEPSRVDGP